LDLIQAICIKLYIVNFRKSVAAFLPSPAHKI
jgi:hypothetical protein